jgi:hypothetical protein
MNCEGEYNFRIGHWPQSSVAAAAQKRSNGSNNKARIMLRCNIRTSVDMMMDGLPIVQLTTLWLTFSEVFCNPSTTRASTTRAGRRQI